MTLKFLALQGAPHIYDITRLRVNGKIPAYHHWVFYTNHPIVIGWIWKWFTRWGKGEEMPTGLG
jgi:hypothetical protein